MVDWIDLDLRYADHAARVAHANGAGWRRQEQRPTRATRPRRGAAVVAPVRLLLGGAIVRAGETVICVGERLRRTPAANAFDPVR